MTSNQHKHHRKDRTPQIEQVAQIITDYPGATPQLVEEKTGLISGTVSARINDLERRGRVYRMDVDGESKLYAVLDPQRQKQLADKFRRAKALEQFASAMKKLKPHLPASDVTAMRRVYQKVKSL